MTNNNQNENKEPLVNVDVQPGFMSQESENTKIVADLSKVLGKATIRSEASESNEFVINGTDEELAAIKAKFESDYAGKITEVHRAEGSVRIKAEDQETVDLLNIVKFFKVIEAGIAETLSLAETLGAVTGKKPSDMAVFIISDGNEKIIPKDKNIFTYHTKGGDPFRPYHDERHFDGLDLDKKIGDQLPWGSVLSGIDKKFPDAELRPSSEDIKSGIDLAIAFKEYEAKMGVTYIKKGDNPEAENYTTLDTEPKPGEKPNSSFLRVLEEAGFVQFEGSCVGHFVKWAEEPALALVTQAQLVEFEVLPPVTRLSEDDPIILAAIKAAKTPTIVDEATGKKVDAGLFPGVFARSAVPSEDVDASGTAAQHKTEKGKQV